MISQEYQSVAEASNERLFKTVNIRIGTLLVRAQTEKFIEGFSSDTKNDTASKPRHTVYKIRAANFKERQANVVKPKDSDFNIYVSSDKTGPVALEFHAATSRARTLLSRITGPGREAEVKGPHVIENTTTKDFKLVLSILSGVLGRSGAKLHNAARASQSPAP